MADEDKQQHHQYSASASEGWLNCPGKITMERGIKDEYSPWADEGSAAHYVGGICLEKGEMPDQYIGRTVICWAKEGDRDGQSFVEDGIPEGAVERSRWEVNEEMVENLQIYVDTVRADLNENGMLLAEERLHFGSAIGVEGAFGTTDAAIVFDGGECWNIYDLKYGRKPVDATGNTQMQLYALGALEEYGLIFDASKLKRIKATIIQPRIDNVSSWEVSIDDLMLFAERCKKAIELAEAAAFTVNVPNDWCSTLEEWQSTYLKPSDKGCMWCKAKGSCPAFAAQNIETVYAALPISDADLDSLDDIAPANPTGMQALALPKETFESSLQIAIANVPHLELDVLAKLYAASSLFDEFRDAVASRFHNALMSGAEHPDWKLVKGRAGNRKWENPEKAEETLKAMRLKADEMYDKKVISPTKAEKLLEKEFPRKWGKLQAQIVREEGKITLAPAHDKRPAYSPIDLLPDMTEKQDDLFEVFATTDQDDLDLV